MPSKPNAERWFTAFVRVNATDNIQELRRRMKAGRSPVVVITREGSSTQPLTFYVFLRGELGDLPALPDHWTLERVLQLPNRVASGTSVSRDAARREFGPALAHLRVAVIDATASPREVCIGSDSLAPAELSAITSGGPFAPAPYGGGVEGATSEPSAALPSDDSLRQGNGGPKPSPSRGRTSLGRPGATRSRSRAKGPRTAATAAAPTHDYRRIKRNGGGGTRAKKSRRPVPSSAGRAITKARRAPAVARARASTKHVSRDAVDAQERPPRSAYPRIDAPPLGVLEGHECTFTIGLRREKQARVSGRAIVVPDTIVGDYSLDVQVSAFGFALVDEHDHWSHRVHVTSDDPYPFFELRVEALPLPEGKSLEYREVQVQYVLDGQPIGSADRLVAVADSSAALPKRPKVQAGATLVVPTNIPSADVTATIRKVPSDQGILMWTLNTGQDINYPRPDGGLPQSLGDEDPRENIETLCNEMARLEKRPGKYDTLSDAAKRITNMMPPELWTMLRGVAEELGRPPTLQVLTEEPYIAWELAAFPEPLLDPSMPPFLAAQVPIARWVMGSGENPRPTMPPPVSAPAASMAVIYGDYPNSEEFGPLVDSQEEALALIKKYGADKVKATLRRVLGTLGAPADVLHFACHGNFDRTGKRNGVLMEDGRFLLPAQIGELNFGARRPFVFLNACQAGRDQVFLGDYAGLAQAFLVAGAAGVIAPLWSVDDAVSGQIARRFYQRVFRGDLPAEVMRSERQKFRKPTRPTQNIPKSGTPMAYVYFGHPNLQLVRP